MEVQILWLMISALATAATIGWIFYIAEERESALLRSKRDEYWGSYNRSQEDLLEKKREIEILRNKLLDINRVVYGDLRSEVGE